MARAYAYKTSPRGLPSLSRRRVSQAPRIARGELRGRLTICWEEGRELQPFVRKLDSPYLHEDCFVSHVEARYAAERPLLAERRPAIDAPRPDQRQQSGRVGPRRQTHHAPDTKQPLACWPPSPLSVAEHHFFSLIRAVAPRVAPSPWRRRLRH